MLYTLYPAMYTTLLYESSDEYKGNNNTSLPKNNDNHLYHLIGHLFYLCVVEYLLLLVMDIVLCTRTNYDIH